MDSNTTYTFVSEWEVAPRKFHVRDYRVDVFYGQEQFVSGPYGVHWPPRTARFGCRVAICGHLCWYDFTDAKTECCLCRTPDSGRCVICAPKPRDDRRHLVDTGQYG